LPSENFTYNESNSILNAFLLQPYVKGTIENADHYFLNDDRKTNQDLDVLLVVQGWSKINWKSIFHTPQLPLHNFESGFQIAGRLNSNHKNDLKEIILRSDKDALMESSEIDEDGYFRFTDLHLSDSTLVSFSAKDKKGNLIKPKLYYNIYPKNYVDSLNIESIEEPMARQNLITALPTNNPIDFKSFIYEKQIVLDTITLKEQKAAPRNEVMYGRATGNYIDLENRYNKFSSVIEVIRDNGFDVKENLGDVFITSRRSVGVLAFSRPAVYINNVPAWNLSDLKFLTLQDVRDIHISKTPSFTGPTDFLGGTINIFLNQSLYASNKTEDKFNSSEINLGFEKAKEYYSPNYDITKREEFSKFGVISWKPNVVSNNNGEFSIEIPNYNHGTVTLYINGMSEKGRLISKKEIIDGNSIDKQ